MNTKIKLFKYGEMVQRILAGSATTRQQESRREIENILFEIMLDASWI